MNTDTTKNNRKGISTDMTCPIWNKRTTKTTRGTCSATKDRRFHCGNGSVTLVARKRCRMASRKDAQIVFELHPLKHSPEQKLYFALTWKIKTWQSTHSLIIDHIPSPQLPIHLPLFCTEQRKGDHPHYTIRHKYTMVTKIRHHASK